MRTLVALLAVAAVGCAQAQESPPFDAALEAHFDAIRSRDLTAFEATVTLRPAMTLIFPDGQILRTRREVVDLHREWFAEDDWTWEPQVVERAVGEDLAHALVRYTYTDGAGRRESWLSLLFRLEDGSWRLFHDQNTRLTPPAAK